MKCFQISIDTFNKRKSSSMVVITGKYKYNFSTNIQLQLVSVLVYPMILLYRYMYYKINPQAASNYGLTSGVQQCYL